MFDPAYLETVNEDPLEVEIPKDIPTILPVDVDEGDVISEDTDKDEVDDDDDDFEDDDDDEEDEIVVPDEPAV